MQGVAGLVQPVQQGIVATFHANVNAAQASCGQFGPIGHGFALYVEGVDEGEEGEGGEECRVSERRVSGAPEWSNQGTSQQHSGT